MQNTISCTDDIEFYFLDFLTLSQIKLYTVLSKSTSKSLNFDNICKEGCLNLLKAYTKNFHKTDYNKCNVIEPAKNGHLEVVKYLVTAGADISTENNYAMRWASRNGHLEVIKYLVTVVLILVQIIIVQFDGHLIMVI